MVRDISLHTHHPTFQASQSVNRRRCASLFAYREEEAPPVYIGLMREIKVWIFTQGVDDALVVFRYVYVVAV